MTKEVCNFCGNGLENVFVDLGLSPLANSYTNPAEANKGEMFFPLRTYVCGKCFLVQAPQCELPENIFSDYHYFSSYSKSWVEHAKQYAHKMVDELKLSPDSLVVEIASNDGYLLQHFKEKGIKITGVEPAKNIAKIANEKGINTICEFFGEDFAKASNIKADLVAANNVLAHVPDINSFVKGFKVILKENATLTVEFPSVLNLIKYNQFDTIYHEHFSYLSLSVVSRIFSAHGLKVYNVEKLPTHGGSLRVYACHKECNREICEAVSLLLDEEKNFGLADLKIYDDFKNKVLASKRNILKWLFELKEQGKKIIGYGAAAKGNTLINYCGIREDIINYVVDANPHKQNKYLPGSRIPIYSGDKIKETKPDYIIILPWNLKDEISKQLNYINDWGGKFITLIPEVSIFDVH
ncbi:MAG: class I SAM-dependent methyltransferase [Defluviitaleaceae bacterium]|nr:class I SAM-dependent methyltransferase [Defluviitaleaceae bacterium]